jgi:hypothetical protein
LCNHIETIIKNQTITLEDEAKPRRDVQRSGRKPVSRNKSPDRLPDNLMRFENATELMDVLQPYLERFETVPSNESTQEVRALSAVAALNHLKRCEKGSRDAAARARLDKQMQFFVSVVEDGMDFIGSKHLSLFVNAIGDRPGYAEVLSSAARRAHAVCDECLNPSLTATAPGGNHAKKNFASKDCTLDARSVALILNAFAKANFRNETLYNVMAKVILRMERTHESMEGQNIGLILNAFSKAKLCNPELFEYLSVTAQALDERKIDVQALSNIVNAFANMGMQDTSLFIRMSSIARQHKPEAYSSQSISNIVNAFARQGIRDDELLAYLSQVAQKLSAQSFSAQSISTCMNGYAKLGYCDAPLMRFLSQAAQRLKPKDFTAQSVAVIVNGCCKCGVTDKRLFSFISDVALSLRHLDAQAIANIVNAFARTNLGSDALYEHLIKETENLVLQSSMQHAASSHKRRGVTGPDIAILVASFDKAGRLDETLLQHAWSLLQLVPPSELTMVDVSSLLHTLSRFDKPHADMVHRLVSVLRTFVFEAPYSSQSLCMAFSACVRLAKSETEVIKRLAELLIEIPTSEFDIIGVISVVGACPTLMESSAAKEWRALLTDVMHKMRHRVVSATSQELTPSICTSLYGAFGNAGMLPSDEALRTKLRDAILACLSRFQTPTQTRQDSESLASILASISASLLLAREDSDQIWDALTRTVTCVRRGEWDSRTLSTLLNSYARAGRTDVAVFEKCSQVIRLEVVGSGEPAAMVRGGEYELWEMSPTAIASVLNSYSKVRQAYPLVRMYLLIICPRALILAA